MSCLIKRILQFQNAVVFGPLVLKDNNGIDVTNQCLYSWSSDSVCWTSWVDYNTYLRLAKNIESDFYLRILISTQLSQVYLNDMLTTCYSMCLYNPNPFIEDFCGTQLFNPYVGLDCALQLQSQLANSIICMLGIPVYYFRVLPQHETADYTFKEYVMHNVTSVKQIKMMIPDGTMPSSKPQFSDLDFDWEVDWEVELGKAQFAAAFGDEAFPKQRDFIYVPMMKRMWEVNSAYDEKNEGLMWQSTTWKLGLIKWNEKTNVEQGEFEDLIDNLVVNTNDNVFAELEANEQRRESAVEQADAPRYVANNIDNVFLEDFIRQQFTKSKIRVIDKQFNHGSLVVAKNMYQFLQPMFIQPMSGEKCFISYQKGYCGEDATLSFIISTNGEKLDNKQTLISIGNSEIKNKQNIEIQCDGSNVYLENASASLVKEKSLEKLNQTIVYTDYLVICKWSRKNAVKEIFAFPYVCTEDVPSYQVRPEMYKFDFEATDEDSVKEYNNDYIAKEQQRVIVHGNAFLLTNIKLYNSYMSNEDAIKESLKYTTKNKSCIFNDVARPIDAGNGFSVK